MNPLDYAQQIAYSTKETLRFTYDMAVKYKDSPGMYVECGVAAGAQIIALAYGAISNPKKSIVAFDSFEGIPLPSNRDDQMPGLKMLTDYEISTLPDPGSQQLITSGATVVPIEHFWDHIDNAFGTRDMPITAVKGWFEDTVKDFQFDISILRLDGDLYNSTWVCLQHLFPKVIKGGCVIIDDWELPGCRSACVEYFALINYEPEYKYISNICYFFK